MTWPGETNYTRSRRLPKRMRTRRRRGAQRHIVSPRVPGYYRRECVPLTGEDVHVCDATCRYLQRALVENEHYIPTSGGYRP